MAERKSKRESELIQANNEEHGFVLEPRHVEVGSGYTISVDYDDDERQIINVKTYGEVDIKKIRREIARIFPNARIRQLNHPSVAVVKKRKRKK